MTRSARSAARSLAPVCCVAIAYAASRAVFYAVGVRFDAEPLNLFWQYVDPQLLRDRLLESLYSLWAQPPLFNAYLGGVLKLCGARAEAGFWVGALLFGVLLHGCLYALVARCTRSRWLAAGVTVAYAVGPASILYESWLFYTQPVAALLLAAALALHRYASDGRRRDGLAAFALLAATVLTRSLLQPVWYLACAAGAVGWLRGSRRRTLWAAALPLLAVLAVPVKNAVEFGSFGTSGWFGMNLAKMITPRVPRAERARAVERGELTPVALVRPFSVLDAYPASYRRTSAVPLLDRTTKSAAVPGRLDPRDRQNFHQISYLEIARAYRADALTLIARHPGLYAASVARALWIFLGDPAEAAGLTNFRNRAAIRGYQRIYSALLVPTRAHALGWAWIGFAALATAHGLSGLRGGAPPRSPEAGTRLALGFAAFTVVYVAAVGNAFDIGENQRIRALVEPLLVALMAALAASLVARRRRRSAAASAPGLL